MESLEELHQDMGGEFGSTLRKFLEKLPDRLDAIANAVEQRDPNQSSKAAHQLKGVAATMGADRFSALCSELEAVGRAGPGPQRWQASGVYF